MFTLSLQTTGNVNNENIYQNSLAASGLLSEFITSNDVKRGFDQFKLRRFNTTDFIVLLVGIESHPLGISRAPMHFSTFWGGKLWSFQLSSNCKHLPTDPRLPFCPPLRAFSIMS